MVFQCRNDTKSRLRGGIYTTTQIMAPELTPSPGLLPGGFSPNPIKALKISPAMTSAYLPPIMSTPTKVTAMATFSPF